MGHDHANDFCFNKDDITLCQGGGCGYGGYGGYGGYLRRIRMFEIDLENNSIASWKRTDNQLDEIVDYYIYNIK